MGARTCAPDGQARLGASAAPRAGVATRSLRPRISAAAAAVIHHAGPRRCRAREGVDPVLCPAVLCRAVLRCGRGERGLDGVLLRQEGRLRTRRMWRRRRAVLAVAGGGPGDTWRGVGTLRDGEGGQGEGVAVGDGMLARQGRGGVRVLCTLVGLAGAPGCGSALQILHTAEF